MKINKEGFRIILVTLLIALAVVAVSFIWLPGWLAWFFAFAMLCIVTFVLRFFRDPAREHLEDPSTVFSPCDGEVVALEQVYEGEFLNDQCIQVSIFMSIWNVHVNWFPVGGRVVYFRHHHGKFLVAWHPKSSEENERTTTVVEVGSKRILFRQIAGFVARRIVNYAVEGTQVGQNSRLGFIKFGSRVDLFLPLDSEIHVMIGDKVRGSITNLARLK